MKDARGHGSNGTGSNSALTQTQGPAPSIPRGKGGKGFGGATQIHGGTPMSSNAQAAQSLMSTLKSTQAPVHPAMVGKRRSPDGGSAS